MQKLLAATIVILCLTSGLFAQDNEITDNQWDKISAPAMASARQLQFSMAAKDYSDERTIRVQLPRGYDAGTQNYPVMYVLDADWNFPLVASYTDFLAFWGRIPETIVVGIDNLNRNSDFVSPADRNFPLSGNQDRFLNFVKTELKPSIEAGYRTSGFDTIFGHSFGGVAALAFLFNTPGLFDAHVAIGTSTWVADRNSFEIAERYFTLDEKPRAFLYLSHAEFDGGDTVPANFEFWALLKRKNPSWLDIHVSEIAATNHFTAVVPSLFEAMEAIYPANEIIEQLRQRLVDRGASALTAWAEETSTKYGPRFHPQLMELGIMAITLAAEGQGEGATALADWVITQNTNNAQAYAFAAQTYLTVGEREKAKTLLDDALRIAKETGYFPNQRRMYQRFRQQLEN